MQAMAAAILVDTIGSLDLDTRPSPTRTEPRTPRRGRNSRPSRIDPIPICDQEELMSNDSSALGPISYLIVEFPGNKMTGEGHPILVDLVDRGLIRILDLVFVTREIDGSTRVIRATRIDRDGVLDVAMFEGVGAACLMMADVA